MKYNNLPFIPSKYQIPIFDWFNKPEGNKVIDAVAGGAKTSTIVEGAKFIPPTMRTLYLAFNRDIADTLAEKLSSVPNAIAKGMHAFGYAAIREHYNDVRNWKVNKFKYNSLIYNEEIPHSLGNGNLKQIRKALADIINMAQLTVTNPDSENLHSMVTRYGIFLPFELDEVVPIIKRVMLQGLKDIGKEGEVSFNDMVYAPVILRLPFKEQYDIVATDETQDFNNCQRLLLERAVKGNQFIGVGDPQQAIYFFAGAEADSFDRIRTHFNAESMPLSVCYRCPSSVVDQAKEIVPRIESREDAPLGVNKSIPHNDFLKELRSGDVVICRLTAPLVKLCLQLIIQGKQARVKGKDIASRLTGIVEQIADKPYFEYKNFPKHLEDWRVAQLEKLRARRNSEDSITMVEDYAECLLTMWSGMPQVTDQTTFCKNIDKLFEDKYAAIWLMTVHKAKGGEWKRVFIYRSDKLPLERKDMTEDAKQQELHLKYVAITRAKQELYWVIPDKEQDNAGII